MPSHPKARSHTRYGPYTRLARVHRCDHRLRLALVGRAIQSHRLTQPIGTIQSLGSLIAVATDLVLRLTSAGWYGLSLRLARDSRNDLPTWRTPPMSERVSLVGSLLFNGAIAAGDSLSPFDAIRGNGSHERVGATKFAARSEPPVHVIHGGSLHSFGSVTRLRLAHGARCNLPALARSGHTVLVIGTALSRGHAPIESFGSFEFLGILVAIDSLPALGTVHLIWLARFPCCDRGSRLASSSWYGHKPRLASRRRFYRAQCGSLQVIGPVPVQWLAPSNRF